ncbi:MAG: aminopeptidase P family protein [Candidatus Dormibacteraeota bacterium]|uniref:Aminopeptidase P family protein n=2 Tax=Candidatus Dormibacteraceae TaxID=3126998 RepID=A0A934NI74_9BACT|nr:aminopeptidase P family protein [Candidatus Dormibacteraeota bacterium]MBJ7606185.1 aminopeptidase P family protein [Candidatus Dormibacteraeota bacterium]
MDLSFLDKPHEWDPRRTYSTTGTDWQARVDFDRLRRDRLTRARMMMEKFDLGAIVCFVGENVRYITSVYQGNWKNNIFIRYCVLPRGGDPVLFETAGSDMECAKIDAPWLNGNVRPAITWKWAETAETMMADRMVASIYRVLEEHKVTKEKIAVDMMDPSASAAFERAGLNIVSAGPAMSRARVVKTPDEIECLKISSAIGDTSFWKIEHEWLKPGVTEAHITAKVNEYLYEKGFDFVYDIIVASGGNTSPYRRWHTDKTIRLGDLVIIDQNAIGPGGYFVDFVRCFKVGGNLSPREKDLYKECHESMYAAIEQMRAGNTTRDVAEKLPVYDDDEYGTVTLQQFAHSIGLSLYEGMWISRAYSLQYPVELEEGMYFAAETFAGHPGLEQTVRLEENLLVTKDGPILFTKYPFYDEAL